MFIGYVALMAWRGALLFPEISHLQWKYALKWSSIALMLSTAFWVKGDEGRGLRLLVLAFLGLFFAILLRSDWGLFPSWLKGKRYCFGFPCLTTSLLSGVYVIAFIMFSGRIFNLATRVRRKYGLLAGVFTTLFIIFAFLFILQVLITTQSRGVWLFLTIVLAGAALGSFLNKVRSRKRPRCKGILSVIAVFSLMAFVAWYEAPTLQARFLQEREDIYKLFHLDIDSLPYETSIGARTHVWCFGVRTWWLSPILGWGPGTNVLSQPFYDTKAQFHSDVERVGLSTYVTHLHSDLVEALVRLGVVGTAMLGGILLSLVCCLVRARMKGDVSQDLFLFLFSSISLMFLFSLIEFRIVHVPYRNLLILISAISLGLSVKRTH